MWNILGVKTGLRKKVFSALESYGNTVSTGQTRGSAMCIEMSKAEASEDTP